jgi:hypothetical protein
VQHSAPDAHAVPIRLQALASGAHAGGLPRQLVLQHSASWVQLAPSAAHVATQIVSSGKNCARHVPTQQSPSCTQSAPMGLQLPGPKSHLPTASHVAQHAPHASPVGRQGAVGSGAQRPPPPSPGEQRPLQHSASDTQSSPTLMHEWPATHTPPRQAIAQQSSDHVHAAPTGRQ